MKRILVLAALAALFSFRLCAEVKKNHFELSYGLNNVRMASYNNSIVTRKAGYEALGIRADLFGMTFAQLPSAAWVISLDNGFAGLLKADLIGLSEDRNTVYHENGRVFIKEKAVFNSLYLAAGARKYFRPYFETALINWFAGVDAGICMAAGARYSAEYFDEAGNLYSKAETGLTGTFFCFCAEAGADYWLNSTIGAVMKAGMRFGTGRFDGQAAFDIDLGGLYVTLGICVSPF